MASHLKCSEVGKFNEQWERSSENGKRFGVVVYNYGRLNKRNLYYLTFYHSNLNVKRVKYKYETKRSVRGVRWSLNKTRNPVVCA